MTFTSHYNDNTHINVHKLIEEVTEEDLIYDIVETGIVLNRFLPDYDEKCQLILWVDPMCGEIKLEKAGYCELDGDSIIEDVENFQITQEEIEILLKFEETKM